MLRACLLAAAFLFVSPPVSFAQTAGDSTQNFGLSSEFSEVAVQSDRDLKSTITTIVNITLGFLGIVAVVIILYAGYLWMTASGNEERIARAKSILRNAVIGLVIIMSSWAIAAFVINRIGGAIGGRGGDAPGSDASLFPGSGSTAAFRVDSFETAHNGSDSSQDVQLCSSIQAQFNHWLNTEVVENLKNGDTLTIKRNRSGTFIDEGTIAIEKRNNVISFQRVDERGARVDWTPNATYEVRLDETLKDTRGLALSDCADCDGARDGYHYWIFTTGTTRDSVAPTLAVAYPGNGETNVPRSTIFSVAFSESIDVASVIAAAGELVAANVALERKLPDGTYAPALGGEVFDATLRGKTLLFSLNENYTASFDGRFGLLEPYTEYRLTIQNVSDLCGNTLSPPVEITFTTGADLPGVSFVRPSDGYGYSCPQTPAFVQFRTSMYNVRTQSCGVHPSGNAGLVLTGTLAPAGVGLRPLPEDNFSRTGNPNDFCKQYSFDLNPDDAADDLIPGTAYHARVSFLEPGRDVADAENHAWSFTAAEASACAQEPYISYVSGLRRNAGRWQQCLTIQGAYFGNPKASGSRAHTALSLDSPLNTAGLTPDIEAAWRGHRGLTVSDQAWSDASIAGDFIGRPTEPLPAGLNVDFDIAVSVDHGAPIGALQSNAVRFTVDTTRTFTGPCLYAISPLSGYWGDGVTLSGSRLGLAPAGQLEFYNQKVQSGASAGSWTNTRIQSRVPEQAQNNPSDGEVSVTVSGVQSNKLEFSLRAGVGQSCAVANSCSADSGLCSPGLVCTSAGSACRFTCQVPDTFRIISTQPSASCTDSCTRAVISFEASKPVADVGGNRVQLKKCPAASRCAWNDAQASPVGASVALDGSERVVVTPQTPGTALDAGVWYLVRVAGGADGVVSQDGKVIANPNASTDALPGNDAYVWSFKTGTAACAVNRIEQNLSNVGFYEGETANLAVRSYGPSNSCSSVGQEIVAPNNFSWRPCEYVSGDFSFECRQSCNAPTVGGAPIITVAAGSSSQSAVTGVTGSSDGSVRALACAFYDEGSTHLKDGASATVYAACSTNADCTRGSACTGSVCLQDGPNKGRCSPTVTSFSPAGGVSGTWTTISGCYFGSTRGEVSIGANPDGSPALAAESRASWCGATWGDSQIIAEVAPGAVHPGPVRVTRPTFDSVASSGSFTPSGESHPGICRLTPVQGRPG
ncbi:MAG: Ig-like domain-containing protein, partial [Parcubacteria group bacterium]|nr:Ig-like domain-containing protein [Parcubacteria group bacterium]